MGCNKILDRYIAQLVENSTPQAPAWNIEKIRAGKENTWNYIDGCMIKALIELYEITGEERYLTFADSYIDFFVQEDGTIKHYDPQAYNLDNVNAGKTLYKLYELTDKPKYRAAMDTIYGQLESQPRTKEGVFWHKAIYPNQIWLDGMYMAQPFYMQYELSFHNRRACSDSYHMFEVVHDLMRNPLNGLYYHAYDSSRKQFWCHGAHRHVGAHAALDVGREGRPAPYVRRPRRCDAALPGCRDRHVAPGDQPAQHRPQLPGGER